MITQDKRLLTLNNEGPPATEPATKSLNFQVQYNTELAAISLPSRRELLEFGRDMGIAPLDKKLPSDTPWYARLIYGLTYLQHKAMAVCAIAMAATIPMGAVLATAGVYHGMLQVAAVGLLQAALGVFAQPLLAQIMGKDIRRERETIINYLIEKKEAGVKPTATEILVASVGKR